MNLMAQPIQPEKAYFKDDGSIPNNALPLPLYRQSDTPDLPSAIEERFAKNNWTGSWRAGVFPFHHYHSTTHEVLLAGPIPTHHPRLTEPGWSFPSEDTAILVAAASQ